MGQVLTHAQWNDIIRRVNDLAANRPNGCPEFDPIPEVEPRHKWSWLDILVVQNRLYDMCNDNTFTTWSNKWKQGFVDEINAAIERGWCGCEDLWTGPYSIPFPAATATRNYHSASDSYDIENPYPAYPPCFGDEYPRIIGTVFRAMWKNVIYWSPTTLQVGLPGISGRVAQIRFTGTKLWSGYHDDYYNHSGAWSSEEPFSGQINLGTVSEDGQLEIADEVEYSTDNEFQDYLDGFIWKNNQIFIENANCDYYSAHYEYHLDYSVSESNLWIDRP